jgi:hypothetical protein
MFVQAPQPNDWFNPNFSPFRIPAGTVFYLDQGFPEGEFFLYILQFDFSLRR